MSVVSSSESTVVVTTVKERSSDDGYLPAIITLSKMKDSQKIREVIPAVMKIQDPILTALQLHQMKSHKPLVIWLEKLADAAFEMTPPFHELLHELFFDTKFREVAVLNLEKLPVEDLEKDLLELAHRETFLPASAFELMTTVVKHHPEILQEFYPVIFRTLCEIINEPEIIQTSSVASFLDDLVRDISPEILRNNFGRREFILLLVLCPQKMNQLLEIIVQTPEQEDLLLLAGYDIDTAIAK